MAESDPMMLGMDLPETAAPASNQPYRVLARKYRPQTFADLIGQEAMVRTLGNAIKRDRLAHAFLLTGVRGVGKTSTARLIAKALNCIGPDGSGGPTIAPCNVCEPCRAISEGRHIDVIEMDAASNRGIDDAREIKEAVRYAAVSARYKVYIVDEVHMMTKEAFNALLKTLEEPPPHVKFLLATTEVHKLPVTILSRCQRFDLRRIPADRLAAHFGRVAHEEGVEVEEEALALIARAAEGSARDGLSILDQAIAMGEGNVTADQVREMLGLSDRGAVRTLLGRLLAGDAPGALAGLKEQYDLGVEPASLLRLLLEAVHGITCAKVGNGRDPAQSVEEREAYAEWAAALSFATVHRLWQLLLKGLDEVNRAPLPLEAAEMALLRVIHASELPDPGALAARLANGAPVTLSAPAAPVATASLPAPSNGPPADFSALVEALHERGQARLSHELSEAVGLVRYAPPDVVLRSAGAAGDFSARLREALKRAWPEIGWQVSLTEETAALTLAEQEAEQKVVDEQAVRESPLVKAALEVFPGAELVDYTLRDQRK